MCHALSEYSLYLHRDRLFGGPVCVGFRGLHQKQRVVVFLLSWENVLWLQWTRTDKTPQHRALLPEGHCGFSDVLGEGILDSKATVSWI